MKTVENQTSNNLSAEELQQEIVRLKSLLEKKDELLDKKDEQIQKKEEKIQKLTDQLVYFRRAMFGRSSERFIKDDPNQLKLDFQGMKTLPEEEAYDKAQSQEAQTITYQRKKQKEDIQKPVRLALPEHLEREVVVIEPENIPQGSVLIGQEVSERLEIRAAAFYVKQIVRPKYALPQEQGVVIAQMPCEALPKSNAGPSLLAYLLVSKYQDHLPFYRQIEIFKRSNIHLAASTINGWFSASVNLLELLYQELRRQVLESDYIQIDETTIPVVDKDKPGATRKGYHWVVNSPELKMLFFHYNQGSRSQQVVIELLRHYKGAIQSDGYGAYNIYENKENVLLLGCMAHARRKFEQALENDALRASYALEQMQILYQIERKAIDANLSADQIRELRKKESYPILVEFEKWLVDNIDQVLPKSKIGQAILYTYNIYPRLVRYVIDGRYRIDNNGAENAVRPLALGRKNYLFCQNHEAARHTAIIYSLLGTCKINNVNPVEWLTDILDRINDTKNTELKNLLPLQWENARKIQD